MSYMAKGKLTAAAKKAKKGATAKRTGLPKRVYVKTVHSLIPKTAVPVGSVAENGMTPLTDVITRPLKDSWARSIGKFVTGERNRIILSNHETFLNDKIDIIQAIENGLPYESFETIYEESPFTQNFWAETLGISTKSLNRYKQSNKKFKPLQSEKIIELAEVLNIGKKVFDNDEDFKIWLNTPSIALGHNKPIDLIKNSYGKELVVTELTNIDQGIFV